MRLFLLLFLSIYGTAHAYLLLRLKWAFPRMRAGWSVAIAWCLLMMAAPIATRLLERGGQITSATAVAWVGYIWMGFLFLFVATSVALELLRLLRWLAHFFVPIARPDLLSPRPFFLFCVLTAMLISWYGYFEASHLTVEQTTVTTTKLPKGSKPIRIVQISDLHIGLLVCTPQVQEMVARIQQYQPDLVVATGDIVDGHICHFDGVSQLFRGLQPRLGMFAVLGNHEYYAGAEPSRTFLEQAGFRMLQGQTAQVTDQLFLAGVDDPAATRVNLQPQGDEQLLLRSIPSDRFVLLLKHRPVVEPGSTGLFDLQLSGHVHKGQIFPFNLLTWLAFPVRAGMNQLTDGSLLYVNRGTGTWGPPIRFLAPPELTVIDLVPAEEH